MTSTEKLLALPVTHHSSSQPECPPPAFNRPLPMIDDGPELAVSSHNRFKVDGQLSGFTWGLPVKILEALPIHVFRPVSGPSVCAMQWSAGDP